MTVYAAVNAEAASYQILPYLSPSLCMADCANVVYSQGIGFVDAIGQGPRYLRQV